MPCLTFEGRSQRVLHVLTGHQNKIYCAAFSPDSTLVFSGGVLPPCTSLASDSNLVS